MASSALLDAAVGGTTVQLEVWDPAHEERRGYFSLARVVAPWRDCQGVIIVYDAGVESTFHEAQQWCRYARTMVDGPVILVGNKCDLTHQKIIGVDAFAAAERIAHFETSAVSGEGVNEALDALAIQIFTSFPCKSARRGSVRLPLPGTIYKRHSSCCL